MLESVNTIRDNYQLSIITFSQAPLLGLRKHRQAIGTHCIGGRKNNNKQPVLKLDWTKRVSQAIDVLTRSL